MWCPVKCCIKIAQILTGNRSDVIEVGTFSETCLRHFRSMK